MRAVFVPVSNQIHLTEPLHLADTLIGINSLNQPSFMHSLPTHLSNIEVGYHV